jgi:parallel beta-helix repeat protein
VLVQDEIKLIGDGIDKVFIHAVGERPVFYAMGCEAALISGITFEHMKIEKKTLQGNHFATVNLYKSNVTITNCRMRNGVGDGVWVNDGKATIKNSIMELNRTSGIEASDGAEVTMENNRCRYNGSFGILAASGSQAVIKNNICKHNKLNGIFAVDEKTSEQIVNNTAVHNNNQGIFFHEAGGTVKNNTCNHNADCGIFVHGGPPDLVIKENTCAHNEFGLLFRKGSAATAEANIIEKNNKGGIVVQHPHTNPTLRNNKCSGNGGKPVSYVNGAKPPGEGAEGEDGK